MATQTYSADQVVLNVCGQLINSGYADGDFVSVARNTEVWGTKVGTDGTVTRFKLGDKSGIVKVMLGQESAGNAILNQILKLSEQSPNGQDVGVFRLTDKRTGAVIASAAACWVAKYPEVKRAREPSDYEWELGVNPLEFDLVGSPEIGGPVT